MIFNSHLVQFGCVHSNENIFYFANCPTHLVLFVCFMKFDKDFQIVFYLRFCNRQLVDMYQRYSEAAGLRILGFPCNQFGGQEPGTEAEIKEFAKGKYNVTFDMFSKINVNGGDTHPLWAYLKVYSLP